VSNVIEGFTLEFGTVFNFVYYIAVKFQVRQDIQEYMQLSLGHVLFQVSCKLNTIIAFV
jgi:hypothetical protein